MIVICNEEDKEFLQENLVTSFEIGRVIDGNRNVSII
jgi:hypothetical protein